MLAFVIWLFWDVIVCRYGSPDGSGARISVHYYLPGGGTAVAQGLTCCATNLKVAGSIPNGVIGIFH